jgi:hypothetical protein
MPSTDKLHCILHFSPEGHNNASLFDIKDRITDILSRPSPYQEPLTGICSHRRDCAVCARTLSPLGVTSLDQKTKASAARKNMEKDGIIYGGASSILLTY